MNLNDRHEFIRIIGNMFTSYGGRKVYADTIEAYWEILRHEVRDCHELAMGVRDACMESPQWAPSAALIAMKANPPDHLRSVSKMSVALREQAEEVLRPKQLPGRASTEVAKDMIAKILRKLDANMPLEREKEQQAALDKQLLEQL